MTTAALISVDEYLRTCYRPDCDYLEGRVVERNVGEYDHARVQAKLVAFLYNREGEWELRVVSEQRVQVKPRRFRIPDVCAVRAQDPVEQIFRRPPLLCAEVLSKDDTLRETEQRVKDYLDLGVECVWVLDPGRRQAWSYTAAGGRKEVHETLRVPGTPIEVPLAAVLGERKR